MGHEKFTSKNKGLRVMPYVVREEGKVVGLLQWPHTYATEYLEDDDPEIIEFLDTQKQLEFPQ